MFSSIVSELIMGRIKTQLIKSTTLDLLKNYPGRFSKDFGENKKVLAELLELPSKKLRNIIAGYITRLTQKSE